MGKKWNKNPNKMTQAKKNRFRRGHIVVRVPLKFGLCTQKKAKIIWTPSLAEVWDIVLTSMVFLKVDFLSPWNPQSIAIRGTRKFDKIFQVLRRPAWNPTAERRRMAQSPLLAPTCCNNCTATAKVFAWSRRKACGAEFRERTGHDVTTGYAACTSFISIITKCTKKLEGWQNVCGPEIKSGQVKFLVPSQFSATLLQRGEKC